VLVFFVSRLLVILSAGDILHAVESREAKHTELAWAAATDTLGTQGWGFFDFALTAGNLHHASFTSVSVVYWLLSLVLGGTALTVRLVPLLFGTVGLAALTALIGRRFGWVAAAAAPLCATLAPPDIISWQLSCIGSHTEVVGPLGLMLLAWSAWVDGERPGPLRAGLCGAALGYGAGFSYLMWPVVIGLVALTLLPPRPRASASQGRWMGLGLVLGLWPLWLVFLPDPGGLFGRSITEDPNSTMLAVAAGSGRSFEEYRAALFWALRLEWQEGGVFGPGGQLPSAEGGMFLVRSLVVFGPLVLLPAALRAPGRGQRRLALALAAMPACLLVATVVTSPFDFVRTPYLLPVWFVGVLWPAVGIGLARATWGRGGADRALAAGTGAAALAGLLALAAICLPPIPSLLRLERAPDVLAHRYAAYWHYGFGSVTGDEVERANDLLDVRAADGDPAGAFGFELGFALAEHEMEAGQAGPWESPKPDWPSLRSRFERWDELSHVFANARPDLWETVDPLVTVQNMGRAMAVRADCDGALVQELVARAHDEGMWPATLSEPGFWEGFGYGCGRAAWLAAQKQTPGPGPDGVSWIGQLTEPHAERVKAGWREAARRGPVPHMGRSPAIRSSLAGPT
jgi:hypothetical protein